MWTRTCSNRPISWRTSIDAPFRDRAPRIQRIDGADQIIAFDLDQPRRMARRGVKLVHRGPIYRADLSEHTRRER